MEDNRKFDIQLFADGDNSEPVVEQVVDTPEETEVTETPKKADFFLDENGNIHFPEDEEEAEDSPEEQPEAKEEVKEEVKPEVEEEVKYYTPEDVKKIGLDKLDPNLIPPELKDFYKSMQADYTRKTQAIKEKERALLEQANRTPEQPQEQDKPKSHVEKLAKTAMSRARQVLELGEDEPFNEYDPQHLTAFNIELQNIYSEVARQQTVQQSYQDLIEEYRAKEPEYFGEIDQYAQYRLHNELPMNKAQEIMDAVNTGKLAKVRAFVEDTRKMWHEKHLGIKQQITPSVTTAKPKINPPKVESAGQGNYQSVPKTRNISDIRGKTMDEQVQMLMKWGLA